jgi:hypothetical protein
MRKAEREEDAWFWLYLWETRIAKKKVKTVKVEPWYNLNVLDYFLWRLMAVVVPVVVTTILTIVG